MANENAGDSCAAWDNAECRGTPHCPPRCPRFVDGRGTPLLVLPSEDVGLDAEGLVDLYDCGPAGTSLSYPPYRTSDALLDWLADLLGRARSFVALDDGQPVGHAVFAPVTDEEPEFAVFVDPEYRGRGIAGELLRHCMVHADAEGCRALVMNVQVNNGAMLHLAENHGFVASGEPYGADRYALAPLRVPLGSSPAVDRIGLVPRAASQAAFG